MKERWRLPTDLQDAWIPPGATRLLVIFGTRMNTGIGVRESPDLQDAAGNSHGWRRVGIGMDTGNRHVRIPELRGGADPGATPGSRPHWRHTVHLFQARAPGVSAADRAVFGAPSPVDKHLRSDVARG